MKLDPKERDKMAYDNYQKFSEEIEYNMKVGNKPPLLNKEVSRMVNKTKWQDNYSSINWNSKKNKKKKKEGTNNANTKKH